MKSLIKYICEKYDKFNLQEVVVKFGVKSKDLIIEVPEEYIEDQIQTYLDDTIISKTFAGGDYSYEILKSNAENIADAYFEYTGFEDTSLSADLKWDGHYTTEKYDNFKNIKLKNFKFVVVFDRFELLDNNSNDIQPILKDIFDMCISSEYKWPLDFTLDETDIEYKK